MTDYSYCKSSYYTLHYFVCHRIKRYTWIKRVIK